MCGPLFGAKIWALRVGRDEDGMSALFRGTGTMYKFWRQAFFDIALKRPDSLQDEPRKSGPKHQE
jgi:hypothetical protein